MLYYENLRGSEFAHNHRHVMRSTAPVWLSGILEVINLFTGILFYFVFRKAMANLEKKKAE